MSKYKENIFSSIYIIYFNDSYFVCKYNWLDIEHRHLVHDYVVVMFIYKAYDMMKLNGWSMMVVCNSFVP